MSFIFLLILILKFCTGQEPDSKEQSFHYYTNAMSRYEALHTCVKEKDGTFMNSYYFDQNNATVRKWLYYELVVGKNNGRKYHRDIYIDSSFEVLFFLFNFISKLKINC